MQMIRQRRAVAAAVVVLAILALIVVMIGVGSPDGRPGESGTPGASGPGASAPDGAGVEPVACGPLLANAEIELALGIKERPSGERDSRGSSRGEICTERLVVDESFFVRIEPGERGDFDPSTGGLLGVQGEAVDGVGEVARWFGGEGAEGGGAVGILSVRQHAPPYALYVRIVLGRPDLSGAQQLTIARVLALAALPRFPGVLSEPKLIRIEHGPADRSGESYVDNLLAREMSGDWSRGEGLVATLGLFAGEVAAANVVGAAGVADDSGTGVIQMARAYLEDGSDPVARSEITRLLDRLVVSTAQLRAMAGIGEQTAALQINLLTRAIAQGGEDCGKYYGTTDAPCVEELIFPDLDAAFGEGKYRIWAPLSAGLAAGDWKDEYLTAAGEALRDSAHAYEALGKMPNIAIFLGHSTLNTWIDLIGGDCVITLSTDEQHLRVAYFKQVIAREMASCMIPTTFSAQVKPGYEVIRWWADGLTWWLSAFVYRQANLELAALPHALGTTELKSTLLERASTNWLFFEHAYPSIDWSGIRGLVERLPTTKGGGLAAQEKSLAAVSGIDNLLHTYVRGLTDRNIPDLGGGLVEIDVRADPVMICGRIDVQIEDPRPFGVVRLHLTVDPGKTATLEFDQAGDIRSAWRPGAPGTPGSWSEDLPASLEGEAVIVVTTIKKGGSLTLSVTEVDPKCEEDDDPAAAPLEPCQVGCAPSSYYPENWGPMVDIPIEG